MLLIFMLLLPLLSFAEQTEPERTLEPTAPTSSKEEVRESQEIKRVSGIAKDSRGKALYTEKHVNHYKDGTITKRESEFFDMKGKLIGKIDTDFSNSHCLPDYHLTNYFGDSEEIVKVSSDKVTARYRPPGEKKFNESTFPNRGIICSGYGIAEHISTILPSVISGNVLQLQLLAVPQLNQYPMRVSSTTVDGYESADFAAVRFEFDLSFFNKLIPSADFVFNKADKQLVFYHGPSNIVDKRGGRVDVLIEYKRDE